MTYLIDCISRILFSLSFVGIQYDFEAVAITHATFKNYDFLSLPFALDFENEELVKARHMVSCFMVLSFVMYSVPNNF